MFSSTIIPTIGRPSLAQAVCSVLDQAFSVADFEVIVVNDSGCPLPEAEWQRSERVQVIDTQRHERSVARNTGAAIAKGAYFHFLDDDDCLLPGALDAFWKLAQSNAAADASWLHGHYQSMDNDGNVIAEFDPEIEGDVFAYLVAGEAIPFQASLLEAGQFFKAGGFDAHVTGVEDRDLARRIAIAGKTAGTRATVARIRVGQYGSTTDWSKIAERDRMGRENALRLDGAYVKLRQSARSSYWRGRVGRACLASSVWNGKRGSFLIAASRVLAFLVLMNRHVLALAYWKGLRTKIK